MSSPFPLEDAAQSERLQPTWNPWDGPAKPSWYSGLAQAIPEGLGTGASKLEGVAGGLTRLAGSVYSSVGKPRVVGQELEPIGQDIQADARERVKATTPDPATVGTAANVLHAVTSGAYEMGVGALLGGPLGGAAAVGAGEGTSRYGELREAGVDPRTAAESAALAAGTSAAGALVPGGFGSSLLTRVVTGAGANAGFGLADRYVDHQILEAGGYPEMAEQQRVWDGTQVLIDAALGATFGSIHHVSHADPMKEDAALTANLALRDRQSSPGVATDPAAAMAHQRALEKATGDLMQGERVDVSDSGVDGETYLPRPEPETKDSERLMTGSLRDSGFLDEEQTLKDLENQLAAKRGETPQVEEEPQGRPAPPAEHQFKAEGEEEEEGAQTVPDLAERALQDRPDLEIPGRDGPTSARGVLDRTDESVANDTSDITKGIQAATDCFMRRGG